MSFRPLIVDSHEDLAWGMLTYGRDYTRSVSETRRAEVGTPSVSQNGDTLLGWPEFQAGRIGIVFATLFAAPIRHRLHASESQVYETLEQAREVCLTQLGAYQKLVAAHPDRFRPVRSQAELHETLALWTASPEQEHPVGLVLLMEGADAISDLSDLEGWFSDGLRIIGPAWVGTIHAGGWKEPGTLTTSGQRLLKEMERLRFILDVSHMDVPAASEAMDRYGGPIAATHGNCLALLPGYPSNRQFPDRVIRGVIDRDGVVGVVPYNVFLKVGWTRAQSNRAEVKLETLTEHIDHICQLAGDARHVGIGSDFDGGFGLQSTPAEIDSIADLQLLVPLLLQRGYSEDQVERILGGNWVALLERGLPA